MTATNQHGVHSPFVYAYVTKCLYTNPGYGRTKSEDILLKSIAYFKARRVWLPPQKNDLREIVRHEFPSISFEEGPYDVVYADPMTAETFLEHPSEENSMPEKNNLHNDSLLSIEGIYRTPEHRAIWNRIKADRKVRVTVDLFHCAAVFFRREQAAEHFRIRI